MSDSYDNLFTPEEASRRVVVIASNNDHKVAEIRDILSDVLPGMDFKPMREIGERNDESPAHHRAATTYL